MSIHQEKLNNKDRGFTIIETLVALIILTIALGPALFLTISALNTSNAIKNNLIAANLAQEGVEVVRSIRDTNWFLGRSFDTNLSAGTYRIQWDSDTPLSLSSNPVLKLNDGIYNYSSGENTIFKRTITITKPAQTNIKIKSEVTWNERGRDKSAQVESYLYNWK